MNDPTGGRRDLSQEALEKAGFVRADAESATVLDPRRVDKPWGHELIWAHTELYVGKLLVVNAGEALSLQFHEEKDETLHLLSGQLHLEVGPGLDALRDQPLNEGESIRLTPGTLHRIQALTDCQILEVSTPELDDVVRIQDRYGRAGGTRAGGTEDTGGAASS
jgi:mannose-6-phosphate isomerase